MRKYRLITKKGEGTFSEVIKAQNTKTGNFYAIKCMKSSYKNADQVNNLREIQAIKRLTPHPNIVKLEEVLFDPPTGRLALVFELLEGNLYELTKDRQQHFSESTVKSFMRQIISSLDHMHGRGVFHRDIKPENILVEKNGKTLKLADFGSCRGINGKPPFTEYISTRWYRPPECLLTCGMYGPEMDIWSAGCILFELTTLYPLFPGSDEVDQINRIHRVLGTPKASIIAKLKKHASSQANFIFPQQVGIGLPKLLPDAAGSCLDLLTQAVAYDTSERITAGKAIKHSYFTGDSHFPTTVFKSSSTETKSNDSQKTLMNTIHTVKPSASFTSGDMKEVGPQPPVVPKTRSMVSILLARSNKQDYIEQSKSKNNSFYRSKKEYNAAGGPSTKGKSTTRGNLPRLKSLMQETHRKTNNNPGANSDILQDRTQKPQRRQPKKYAHIRSTGYGTGTSSKTTLPALNKTTGLEAKLTTNSRKLPSLTNPTARVRRGKR